jgi:putative transposase
MPEILTLNRCLTFELNNTSLKHLGCIIQAMLAMSGRVTMRLDIALGRKRRQLSNHSKDFSTARRTGQRYCGCYGRTHCFCQKETYAIAGDEVVTTKSGDKTYGVDWFFSSLAERPIKGLAFFALSLVGLEQRQSYPLRIEQVMRAGPEAQAPPAGSASGAKRKRGRPKGSKNKDKTQVNLSKVLKV